MDFLRCRQMFCAPFGLDLFGQRLDGGEPHLFLGHGGQLVFGILL